MLFVQQKNNEEEKMQINKNKTISPLIALILMITIAISLFALPSTNAANTMKTYALSGLTPNPVGVGQETLVWIGISHPTAYPQTGWEGLTVTVTKPDGTTQTLGPFSTDTTGSTGTTYTPAVVGNYTFQTHFPEQILRISAQGTPANTTMLASDSPKVTLIVQNDPVEYYPGSPLPTEYWSRPINTQLREWAAISGNWLGSVPNLFAPYTAAPSSSHILWTKQIASGGLTGGEFSGHGFHTGDGYEGLMMTRASPVIINGILYYNQYPGNYHTQMIKAVDLRTGEDVWSVNNSRVDVGQIIQYDTRNQMGNIGYVWRVVGSTWHAYSPFTGDWMYTMTNVPASFIFGGFGGTTVRGVNGEILTYTLNSNAGWMTLWNSTAIPALFGGTDPSNGYTWEQWRPMGKTVNATGPCAVSSATPLGISGYSWNKTIPTGLPGSVQVVLADRIIGGSLSSSLVVEWGLSLKPGQEGTLLFNRTWTPPTGNQSIVFVGASLESGTFILRARESTSYYGFNLDTGETMWGPSEPEGQLNIWVGTVPRVAYGKLFSSGYDGVLYCYDAETGDRLWVWEAVDPYTEILWSNNFPIHIGAIADGKIYVYHMEHSANEPKPRGAPLAAIDVETGEELWNMPFRETYWGSDPAVADGILVLLNTYDNRIYAFGKGPSAITVDTPMAAVTQGSSIVIRGTVTDISSGTKDYALSARFPNGVPAISDESMDDWMKYVYMQFERPTNATGVPVTISVVDSNGNYRDIGTTTSNADGFFAFNWKPDIEGQYTVYASFEGSESYWPSHAVTAFAVDPAAPTPEPTEAPVQSAADMYFVPAIAGLFVFVAIIGVVLALLMLRKRP
jgi:outer membrane protein assembly factor BamB